MLRFEFWVLPFRVLGASFWSLKCSVSEFWVLRFRDLGVSFSRPGCFVLRSSFSSASFSKLPVKRVLSCELPMTTDDFLHSGRLVGLTWTHYPLPMRFGSRGPSKGC